MLLGFDGAGFMVSGFMELAPDIPILPLPMPLLDIMLLDIEPLPMLPEVCARAIPEQARPKLKVAAKRSRDMTGSPFGSRRRDGGLAHHHESGAGAPMPFEH
jgi:hypothetical protein